MTAVRAWLIGAALAAGASAWPAHAGILEDDEARRAILELRARVDKLDAEQRAAVAEQVSQLRRSVLELNATIEALRAELARLRGQDEQLARDIAELQRKQKDVVAGVDDRIRRLEPQPVAIDGKEFLADPEERKVFDEAMAAFRAGEFDRAVLAFGNFQKRFPASGYRESGHFWLGNTHYARRNYKDAMASFRALVSTAPTHAKAPEALLAISNCQVELKDRAAARKTLDELIKAYPDSEAALAGRERLAAMRG